MADEAALEALNEGPPRREGARARGAPAHARGRRFALRRLHQSPAGLDADATVDESSARRGSWARSPEARGLSHAARPGRRRRARQDALVGAAAHVAQEKGTAQDAERTRSILPSPSTSAAVRAAVSRSRRPERGRAPPDRSARAVSGLDDDPSALRRGALQRGEVGRPSPSKSARTGLHSEDAGCRRWRPPPGGARNGRGPSVQPPTYRSAATASGWPSPSTSPSATSKGHWLPPASGPPAGWNVPPGASA